MPSGLTHNSGQGQVGVVGAGPGGLAAALLLAARGLDVTVFEAQPEVGGRSSRLRLNGYTFDRGATFFTMPYVLDEIFSAADRRLEEFGRLVRLDPMYRLVIAHGDDDVVLDATQDDAEMTRRIAEISPRDGERFERYLARSRESLMNCEGLFREPAPGRLGLARSAGLGGVGLGAIGSRTIRDQLAKEFEHPAVRRALAPEALLPGASDDEIPALLGVLPFAAHEYGLWHPIGGCNALVRALAESLLEAGGRIETSAPVESIEIEAGEVKGLQLGGRLAGESFSCEHAVINADAAWAIEHLIPEQHRPQPTTDSLDTWRDSRSACVLCFGVEGEVDLPHHVIRVGRDAGSPDAEHPLGEDPSFWVCNPSVNDPTLAPPGHSAVRVTVPVPNTSAPLEWSAVEGEIRESALEHLRRVLGIDLRGRVRESSIITPADWEAARNRRGSTHGLAHTRDQLFRRRPGPRIEGVDGAWLVGAGTHPGASLPMVFRSAQIAAGMVMDSHTTPEPRA